MVARRKRGAAREPLWFVQLSLPDPGGSSPNFEILNPTAWLITRPFAATPGHG